MDYIRSREIELFLQKKWWHRLVKIVIWMMVLYYWFTLFHEYPVCAYLGEDVPGATLQGCGLVATMKAFPCILLFFLMQIFYYKVVLYIIYGKEPPTT